MRHIRHLSRKKNRFLRNHVFGLKLSFIAFCIILAPITIWLLPPTDEPLFLIVPLLAFGNLMFFYIVGGCLVELWEWLHDFG